MATIWTFNISEKKNQEAGCKAGPDIIFLFNFKGVLNINKYKHVFRVSHFCNIHNRVNEIFLKVFDGGMSLNWCVLDIFLRLLI
jgi:hypothetical protein